MTLFIFTRFHAREHEQSAIEAALRDVIPPSREETGCLEIHAFRAIRDSRLFYIHSKWADEAAFDLHAKMPHTVQFRQRVEPLLDHPLNDVIRTEKIL
jgi:quinol monooxygenase YgiN